MSIPYILHFIGGDQVVTDFGQSHADLAAAHQEAVLTAREVMGDRLRDGQVVWLDSYIEILDERGRIVDVVSLEQAAFGIGVNRRHFRVYTASHHAYLVLAPDLGILEANPAYLNATLTDLSLISGKAMFDVFPDNPGDPAANGVRNLRMSLLTVLHNKKAHKMARQRYDIRRRDGTWEERYWQPVNFPVLDENGEVAFIVHNVEDVTQASR